MSTEETGDRFFGQRVRRGEAGGFAFEHWLARNSDQYVAPHGHDDAHFIFVTAGEFFTDAEDRAEPSSPLLVFNPAGTYHSDHFVSAGGFFSVSVPADADAAARELATPDAPSRVGGAAALAAIWRLMSERADDKDDGALSAESLCLELLAATGKRESGERRAPVWLTKACDLLREQHHDLSVTDLAAEIGVHPIHLARTFRKFYRCTPGEYRRALRAHRAAGLLATTRRSAADIAAGCGYADQSHLIRSFQLLYHLSPQQFRQSLS